MTTRMCRRTTLLLFSLMLLALPLSAATRTWSGAGSDNLWSNPLNWGGTAPAEGDDLVFPLGASQNTSNNDFAEGTSFHSIAINGQVLLGNAVTILDGGLTASGGSLRFDVILGAHQTWTATSGAAAVAIGCSSCTFPTPAGTVNLVGYTLTLTAPPSPSFTNAFTFYASVTNFGDVIAHGGRIVFIGATPFTGTFTNTGADLSLRNLNATFNQTAGAVRDVTKFTETTIDGGTFEPYALQTNPFVRTGDLTLGPAATYQEDFVPISEGIYVADVAVTGTVNLGGAALAIKTPADLAVGSSRTIIDNDGTDPVIGTFAGLPEGSIVTSPTGQKFAITYHGGSGNDVVLTAQKYSSATDLSSSVNPSAAGQSVTFTAHVGTVRGTTTVSTYGTVTFYDGATALGSATLMNFGTATFTTSSLAPGSHDITAHFEGDATEAEPSTSAVLRQVVEGGSAAVTPSSLTLARGQSGSLRIDTGSPVSSTQTLTISASDACVGVPASVDVPAGSQSATIPVSALTAPCNARVDIHLPASLGGATLSATVHTYQPLLVSFDPPLLQVAVGQTIAVSVRVTPLEAPLALPLASTPNVEVPGTVNVDASGNGSFTVKGLATGPLVVFLALPPQFGGATIALYGDVTDAPRTPAVRGVSPSSGSLNGGTRVRITGVNFAPDCWADFGGVLARDVDVVSVTEMLATTPAHAAGSVTVTPRCNAGNGEALASAFTYVAAADPAPIVTGVSPSSAAPGQDVTIAGSNFRASDTVKFGAAVAAVRSVAPDTVVAMVPSLAPGVVSVNVVDVQGRVSTTRPVFTVLGAPLPTISNVTPRVVPAGGELALDGTGFRAENVVHVGGTAARVMVVSYTHVVLRVPALPAGSYDVEVLNNAEQVVANGGKVTVADGGVGVAATPICSPSEGGRSSSAAAALPAARR